MTDLLLHFARLIDPARGIDARGHIAVTDGVITAAGTGEPDKASMKAAAQSVDCGAACLAPGLVDMRVQTSDPGAEHLEDLATLLHAAAAGGITSIVALPDARPVIDDASMIDSLSLRATRIDGARLFLYGAATTGLQGKAMAELGMMAEAGAVGFANGTRTIMDSLVMRRLLSYCGMLDKPLVQHCEDHALTAGSEMNESETSTRLGLIGAPAAAEAIIIDRDLHLVRMTGARYHVAHISTRNAVNSIRRAKDEGLAVTADTAPPYFMLNELSLSTYATAFKLAPPLRSEDDREAIIERISMLRAMECLSIAPASILDIDGGALIEGAAADLVLFDPSASWVVRAADFASNSRITPFEGLPVQGRVRSSWVGGMPVFTRS